MIIVDDIIQGTDEWLKLRCGVITASEFSNLITPTGLNVKAEKRNTYIMQKAGELVSKTPDIGYNNSWMEKGKELESEARDYFRLQFFENDLKEHGFIFKDDSYSVGCSPDGILYIDNTVGLEIKCPKTSTHVKYLVEGKLPTIYIPQVQGSMLVTGFDSWYFLSYCPGLKPLLIKVERDDNFIDRLSTEIDIAVSEIKEIAEKIT